MSKHQDKQRRGAGLSSLRPRLDQLLRGQEMARDDRQLGEKLDALTQGIKPASFLPIVIASFADAPAETQASLGELVPGWLSERGHLAPLRELLERHALDGDKRQLALAWLASAGADAADLAQDDAWDSFYDSYTAGNPMQASLMIFFYTNRRRNRVHGLSLLLDFEPPWDGAVKDAMRYPQRAPDDAIEEFVRFWDRRGEDPQRLTAVEAKRRAIEALEHNRQSNIRLHPDLLTARDLFVRDVLALPDGPDTPPFSAADFDYLAANGRHPEALRRNERMFGYEARLPDGQKIRIFRGPDD
jgi:hypothetical protein